VYKGKGPEGQLASSYRAIHVQCAELFSMVLNERLAAFPRAFGPEGRQALCAGTARQITCLCCGTWSTACASLGARQGSAAPAFLSLS
jgi:hypothetical protein